MEFDLIRQMEALEHKYEQMLDKIGASRPVCFVLITGCSITFVTNEICFLVRLNELQI